jgi:hypothetical protein
LNANGTSVVDPYVKWLRAALASSLMVLGCSTGHPAVDPSGRTSAWADEALGAPIDFAVALRLNNMGESAPLRDAATKWLANAPVGGSVDFLGTFDRAGVHAWLVLLPEAPATSFDAILKGDDRTWSAPRDVGSGVRESCSTQDKPASCMFGFRSGGIALVDAASAPGASRVLTRSPDAPVPLTIPGDVVCAGWSDASAVSSVTKPEDAELAKGLVSSSFTFDRNLVLTATAHYASDPDAQRVGDEFRARTGSSLKVLELMGVHFMDQHVDGADLVVTLDFKALVNAIVRIIADGLSRKR